MDIGVQTTNFGPPEPTHRLPGPRPDDLPIAAAVWDAANHYDKSSQAVINAMFEAIKQLEAR